jgi:hypothetical protein
LKKPGSPLRDQLLVAVWINPDDAAPGVGRPERAVRLREDAFRTLKVVPYVLKIKLIDSKIEDGVRFHRVWTPGIV